MTASDELRNDDGPPPILGTWRTVYFAIILYLFILIAVLYGVSRVFAY